MIKLSEAKWRMIIFHEKLQAYCRISGFVEHGNEIWLQVVYYNDKREVNPAECRLLTAEEKGETVTPAEVSISLPLNSFDREI